MFDWLRGLIVDANRDVVMMGGDGPEYIVHINASTKTSFMRSLFTGDALANALEVCQEISRSGYPSEIVHKAYTVIAALTPALKISRAQRIEEAARRVAYPVEGSFVPVRQAMEDLKSALESKE